MSKKDIDLISNGKSEYSIIIPSSATACEKRASEELKQYFYRASGIMLPVLSDGDAKLIGESRYLIIGESRLMQAAGVKAPLKKGHASFIVKSVEKSVFLCGGGDCGTVYAVYAFLNKQFGFEVYALDEIALQTNIRDKKLLSYDIAEIPDIPYRNAFGAKYYYNKENAYKLRMNTFSEVFIKDSYQPWHNSFRYLPPEQYKEQHPKWYTEDGTQLHYTARGDEAELNAMRSEVVSKMKSHIRASFERGEYREYISFTHQDKNKWAEDDSTLDYQAKYGDAYPAAMLIHFLNPVAAEIKSFMAENYPGRKMNVITFAYGRTVQAPVVLKEGKYQPMDDTVIAGDNLSILYAPIGARYDVGLGHEANSASKTVLEKWLALTKSISFWFYSTYFRNYIMFFDSFSSMAENFKIAKNCNAHYVFNESNWNYGDISFNALKEYYASKLLWNVHAEPEKLFADFFSNYYKDAALPMRKLFDGIREHYTKLLHGGGASGYPMDILESEKDWYETEIGDKKYWTQEIIEQLLKFVEQGYDSISHISTKDVCLYNLLYDRICGTGIMLRYLKLKYYRDSFTALELEKEKIRFREDIVRLRIDKYSCSKPHGRDFAQAVMKDWFDSPSEIPLNF